MAFNWKMLFGVIILVGSVITIVRIMNLHAVIKVIQPIFQSKFLSDFDNRDTSIFSGTRRFEDFTSSILKNDSSPCSKRMFLVYRCVARCGGWGARQKGIVSSFLLALLTNRTFIVDIQQPCDVSKYLDPNIYNWTRCKKYVNELPSVDVQFLGLGNNKSVIGALSNTTFHKIWTKIAIVLRVTSYSGVINVIRQHPDTARELSWIKHFPDHEVAGLVLRSLFKPKPKLRNHLKKFIEESTKGRQLVCGHLRMGRNPNIPDEFVSLKPMNEMAMYTFLGQFKDVNKYVIYLASDSDLVREHAANILENYINLNGKIVHVDMFAHLNSSVACEGFYTALFEQYLFSQCDYLIIGRSNFAAMAAYIRGHSRGLYLRRRNGRFTPGSLDDIQTLYTFQ